MIRLPLFLALFAGYAGAYAGEYIEAGRFWPMLGWLFVTAALWAAADITFARLFNRPAR